MIFFFIKSYQLYYNNINFNMTKNTKGGKGHKRQKNSTNVVKFNPKNVPFRSKSKSGYRVTRAHPNLHI